MVGDVLDVDLSRIVVAVGLFRVVGTSWAKSGYGTYTCGLKPGGH